MVELSLVSKHEKKWLSMLAGKTISFLFLFLLHVLYFTSVIFLTKNLVTSSVMNADQKQSIRIETFARWNTGGQIGTNVENGIVKFVWCKTCAQYAQHVIKHVKGKAKDDIQKYICGTNFVTKYTVMRSAVSFVIYNNHDSPHHTP